MPSPFGVYAIELISNSKHYQGIANLGVAPTVRSNKSPLLEAHLFECHEDLYGKDVEVILKSFIRPEKQFSSVEELKIQISKDIKAVKDLLLKD